MIKREIQCYFSPTLLALFFLTLMIFAHNPYTKASLDQVFYFIAVTIVPCIYIYTCEITWKDFKQIFAISTFFIILLLILVVYAYVKVGTLDVRVTSQEASHLYEISVARYLTVAIFICTYLMNVHTKRYSWKILYLILAIILLAIIIFTGKRQALVALILAPFFVSLINLKKPLKIMASLIIALLFISAFYYVILPYTLQSSYFGKTRMAAYLERQYYDEENIASMAGRINAYKTTIEIIKRHPFIGVGFDYFGKYTKHKYNLRNDGGNPHNLWLLIWVELGIFAFLFSMILLGVFLKNIMYAVWNADHSDFRNEINLLSKLSISVLLFSIVGLSLGRGVLIFFIMPLLVEKMRRNLQEELEIKTMRPDSYLFGDRFYK